ncbi:hypothetical protein B296_00050406 [Ensete ventricosum]|uniref:Uncharacterized protein n=1 Tax=Ensete ventricosum TaxID=4639 RepID=A0A426XXA2_ENSVE|nr:hypothetical protein B296_00050406 [Ensete ventricosum]
MIGGGRGSNLQNPQTAIAMLCFIIKQRSRLEKTIDGYDFVERGWRLGSSDNRVETTRLDNVTDVVASRGLLHLPWLRPVPDEPTIM